MDVEIPDTKHTRQSGYLFPSPRPGAEGRADASQGIAARLRGWRFSCRVLAQLTRLNDGGHDVDH